MREFVFGAEDFLYEPNEEILGDYQLTTIKEKEEIKVAIDLSQLLPALGKFKKYAGQVHFLICKIFFKNQSLSYFHYSEWVDEFDQTLACAEETFMTKERELKDERDQSETTLRETALLREKSLLELLDALENDEKFCSLSTRKPNRKMPSLYIRN